MTVFDTISLPDTLPLLPLRDIVIFPGMIAPIFVGREKSMRAIAVAQATQGQQYILLATQIQHDKDNPKPNDLYKVGVIAKIMQTLKLPNSNAKILVEAIEKVCISKIYDHDLFSAQYSVKSDEPVGNTERLKAVNNALISKFKEYVQQNKKINPEILNTINEKHSPNHIINILASHIASSVSVKQELLSAPSLLKRGELLLKTIEKEMIQIDTEQSVQSSVKKQIEKTQRDYYLHEQMKAIQKELGGSDDKSDFFDMEQKIKKLKMSKEAKTKAESELKKLKAMNQMSGESSVVRNYLDTLLSMPWGMTDKEKIDIKRAQEVLDRDHFGLTKVKERIIEYLAVLQRSKKIKGSILCLIGPPGVGKTSLVKSIAESMGRKYAKFALGGVRDEAEIRGHRRTYLGSMPGKIITLLKKVKVNNPVMLLDEIDKMGSDFRGDPASALLEVLDPEQNKSFVDHYLEVEYDLSDIMFIATANTYNIPRALLDRMEIINISGYVESEKISIAKKYLIPKQYKAHAIKQNEIIITDEVILDLIRYYTKESGVRALEREIGAILRKALKKILSTRGLNNLTITLNDLEEYLGVKKYKFGLAEESDKIGAVTGLAYTEVGGDLLTIEAVAFKGKGEVKTTGKLGDVMKESAQAAYSCFRSYADGFGLKYEEYKDLDIHLHVPEGAVPKDGPSAGIAMFTTIVSLMTNKPVRKTVAMTGEITLAGKVLPIGGLREKLLAASRGGIKTVLIPQDNIKDLKDIPDNIKDSLEIVPVANVNQVLDIAILR